MEQVIDLKPKRKTAGQKLRENFKKNASIMWFMLPAIALVLFFGYLPMFGILFAFKVDLDPTNWLYDFFKQGWTFDYLLMIFKNDDILLALGNTLMISVTRLIVCFPMSIIFAILLSEIKKPWLAKIILIIMCLPNFLSWPVTIGIWNNLLHQEHGLINNIISSFGGQRIDFYVVAQDGELAFTPFKILSVFLSLWKGLGWSSIFFYSAIMSIDKEYYEAATIDGASKVQKIWYLTIPGIMPVIALQLVMNITYILDAGFDQTYSMLMILNPNGRYTELILGTLIFDLAKGDTSLLPAGVSPLPLAVATSIVNGLLALFLMLFGNWFVKKRLGSSLW